MPDSIEFENDAIVTINHDLPLPGSHIGRRTIELELGLSPEDFLESARTEGESYAELAGVSQSGQVDRVKAENFLRQRLLSIGFGRDQVERSLALLPKFLNNEPISMRRRALDDDETPILDEDDGWVVVDPVHGDSTGLVREFAINALEGIVAVPGSDNAGKGETTPVPQVDPEPRLFLIEKYAISSFLGDYGMGRTVRTFTLLPGESTTIRLKTWQSTKESIEQSSSIIDSHEQSARDRFSSKMQDETTDKKTKAQTEKWSVEAEAKAGWGWGSASVKGSASGEYQSGREQFARQATESVSEHAKESSSKRQLSVTSSSEVTTESGTESVVEREINNVNMRRVMNFVFRELNQEYTTKLHLSDIHVGFTNGRANTWREVPISGLRRLLAEVLPEERIDEIARDILKVAGVVFDANDQPIRALEIVTYDPNDDSVTVDPMPPGPIDPPTETMFYRFRKGPLGQAEAENPVAGVLLSDQTIVMRTDSVIVEAMLGSADALDSFAMEIQQAAATERTLQNERERLLQDTLAAIADPETRAGLAAALYNPHVTV